MEGRHTQSQLQGSETAGTLSTHVYTVMQDVDVCPTVADCNNLQRLMRNAGHAPGIPLRERKCERTPHARTRASTVHLFVELVSNDMSSHRDRVSFFECTDSVSLTFCQSSRQL